MKDVKARMASEGNNRLLAKYGGHDTGSGRLPYAAGGAVTGKASAAKYASGGPVMDGDAAAPRLDRPGRMKASKKDAKGSKKGTNVNVIVMSGGKPDAAAAPMAPPMPPPDAGPMPPPPMRAFGGKVVARKHGGRVKHDDEAQDKKLISKMMKEHDAKGRKHGGRVHMKAGAGSGEGRLEKEEEYGE